MRPDLGLRPGYHSAQVEAVVRLNTNESPIPPPAAWAEAVAAELAAVPWNRYPDRSAWALRKAVAELHGVAPEQVWCANGSNEVIQTLLLAYGGPGRTAAVWEPTYGLHSLIARLTGTAVAEGSRRPDFGLDLGSVRDVLSAAAPEVAFVCSPNNPTGNAASPSEIDEVIDLAPGLVVVDEAYIQFASESSGSAVRLVADDAAVVVTRTYSKTWALAGLRLGYAIAPREVVAAMERAALPYHLDAHKQVAGRLALRFAEQMEERVAAIVAERGRVIAALENMPVTVWPSEANFVLFRPEGVLARAVWDGLVARSVLVRDCSSWPRLDNCLRVTIGTAEENDAFLAALAEVLG